MMNANPFDNIATKEFDGHKFQIYKLRTSALLKYGTKLAKVIVPILAEKMMQDKLDQIDYANLADLFVDNIDSLELDELLPVLLHQATVNGQPLNYEEFFRGKFMILLQVIQWCIEENFINFLDGSMLKGNFTAA